MVNISFVYKDKEDLDKILEYMKVKGNESLTFRILNIVKDKTKAYQLKGSWGARKDPFALIEIDDKPVKAFYSEVDNDIIESLKNYIDVELS